MTTIDVDAPQALYVRTNRLIVEYASKAFSNKYSIVAFQKNGNKSSFSYACLRPAPCLSVCSIWATFVKGTPPRTKYFVLAQRGDENAVIDVLRGKGGEDMAVYVEDFSRMYDDRLRQRIIASLVINALGKCRAGSMMYNDASLLFCTYHNFGLRSLRRELICLNIGVDEYLNLYARTVTLHQLQNSKKLRNHQKVYLKSKRIPEDLGEGDFVKPAQISNSKKGKFEKDKEDMYELGKSVPGKKNQVPYWPFNPATYSYGKLFVMDKVVELVNKDFDGIVHISFSENEVIRSYAAKTAKAMMRMVQDFLRGRSIYFDDPFNNEDTKAMKKDFITIAEDTVGKIFLHSNKPSANDLIIRFCEPKREQAEEDTKNTDKYRESHYAQYTDRCFSHGPIQHIVYDKDNDEENKLTKTEVRRVLIELFVKDCIFKEIIPKELAAITEGWAFYRYKIFTDVDAVCGCSLSINSEGRMTYRLCGLLSNDHDDDIEQCYKLTRRYDNYHRSDGRRDYMSLRKGDNVYLIIDTTEIPMLDVAALRDGYEQFHQGDNLGLFKRKNNINTYLRGYAGFNLWASEDIDGLAAYTYLSGFNSESLKITKSGKIHHVPHARRIIVLKNGCPERVSNDIDEIIDMVKFGFARWDELMTYPFPFKFMLEYLDNQCEIQASEHWNDITYEKLHQY